MTKKIKEDGMFTLFSKYNGRSASEIRENLIDYLHSNRETVTQLAKGFLNANTPVRNWIL